MPEHEVENASTTEGLPVAPSMGPGLAAEGLHQRSSNVDRRVVALCGGAILLAFLAGFVAQVLTGLIGFITNLVFHGRISSEMSSPAGNHLGFFVILVPVAGALIVGVMARYGSRAIRGHGIPEAMEQVLYNKSRIPARITFLKPLSAAVSIGTGGPFGAEGPIIATGGALGSLLGQVMHITADERKTLLAAGAAAGMAATFGSPVSAVLLAIELLLFEYRPRSLIPVALAAATATGVRIAFSGVEPVFPIAGGLTQPNGEALASYIVIGGIVGVTSVGVTKLVYAIEDYFERIPIHWMWWPALGAIPVGIIGYFAPRTMGVGYDNIIDIISGNLGLTAIVVLCGLKFVSWSISLGSGTSGGTLAPLFTIGGGIGALLGAGAAAVFPSFHIDPRIAALVGMASMFAGASRAVLASVVFAFETTRQPVGLLPLLGGCSAAYLVSCLLMQHSIMTEKLARRGARVPAEYGVDFLDTVLAGEAATQKVITLLADDSLASARQHIEGVRHQGFPVLDADGQLVGVVTRRDLEAEGSVVRDVIKRPAISVGEHATLRDAADIMVRERIGRLPVLGAGGKLIGIVTRSDVVEAHSGRLAHSKAELVIALKRAG